MTIREEIARAVCCGEHGRCILDECEPTDGELTACIALKGYHDKTIASVLAMPSLTNPTEAMVQAGAEVMAALPTIDSPVLDELCWRGSVRSILVAALRAMVAEDGAKP